MSLSVSRMFTCTFSDPFDFDIKLEVDYVGKQMVDLSWSGVPIPHQNFVNLYRVLYLEANLNNVNDPHSAFIVSNIDSIRSSRIGHLRPSTSYHVWLEAYLRNGKVIKSNVLDISTEPGIYEPPSDGK